MSKMELSELDIEIMEMTPEGRKYLEYNDKVGGKPFGNCVGMPDLQIEEDFGGVIGLYDACIQYNITWEKLLNVSGKWDQLPK